jgi:transaldolase
MPAANHLLALRSCTRICIDTADLASIAKHQPEDATTNPTLLRAAAQSSAHYSLLADEALYGSLGRSSHRDRLETASDALAVLVGREILKLIPGRVSTEVDARLAYDASSTVEHALSIIDMYESIGIDARNRVLIKIASTWEGVQAVRTLQRVHGVQCNCTLLFSLHQAAACAEAGAALISPFVGRITDWHREHAGFDPTAFPGDDPGVAVVKGIYSYCKANAPDTLVMGASFRNLHQIEALAGIDEVTITPALTEELACASDSPLVRSLGPPSAFPPCSSHNHTILPELLPPVHTKAEWEARLGTCMARDKLEDGIARFARDAEALEQWLSAFESRRPVA